MCKTIVFTWKATLKLANVIVEVLENNFLNQIKNEVHPKHL